MNPLFSISNLVKTFSPGGETGVRALSGVSLEIREGEFLLISGANGSGKTVLMLILAGLMDPDGGELLFRGQALNTAMGELRRHLGLVFQDADAQMVGETVAEDIAFGPKNLGLSKAEVEERVQNALTALGLEHKRDRPPRNLSGGEKRRLAVAGILAMGCQTIIMDEPFANLDWPGVVQVLEIIRQLKQEGKTVILLTHELEKVLAFADRLVILDRGIIREDGNPAEVLDRLKDEYGVRDPRKSYATVADCTWL
ncbi:energy-coupling factor ABC transporter ATP-binding protein [Treponema primitia]|uniref:energy-coupling factor ABC transporter ATP-binding protein n=1 Tax=Treponema primitia TaxID=88058 RepID=UPI000255515D|nr:ABC transporter ATP-binding protein [Treponema primitia]